MYSKSAMEDHSLCAAAVATAEEVTRTVKTHSELSEKYYVAENKSLQGDLEAAEALKTTAKQKYLQEIARITDEHPYKASLDKKLDAAGEKYREMEEVWSRRVQKLHDKITAKEE